MTAITMRPIQMHIPACPSTSRLFAMCMAVALLPLPAGAVGLGKVSGSPVMGEPLMLEVPLIDAANITAECIQLSPHSAGSDSQFFPRKATTELKKKEGGAQTLVAIHGPEFSQPVLEFRLTVACGYQISRDYVLLPMPGRELRYDPVQINRVAVLPVSESSRPAEVKDLAKASVPSDLSLEKMAKKRYPLQPKARAKFKRMVREANTAALEGIADDAPIPANVDVQIPANIPKKRIGPYIPKAKKTPPAPTATPSVVPESAPPEQPKAAVPAEKTMPQKAAEPPKDRLTISSSTGTPGATQPAGATEGALQEKAADSFAAQDDMVAKLAQTEASFNELKEQILAMESRMASLEKERARLQEENLKKSDWAMLETAVLILVGGLLGAMLMIVMQRRRSRGSYETPLFDIGNIGKK